MLTEKWNNKDSKKQGQTQLIAQHKLEIQNVKAAQATGVSLQQLVQYPRQCPSCMWAIRKLHLTVIE